MVLHLPVGTWGRHSRCLFLDRYLPLHRAFTEFSSDRALPVGDQAGDQSPLQRPRLLSSLSHSHPTPACSPTPISISISTPFLSENHTKVSFSLSLKSWRAGRGWSQMGICFRDGNSWCLQVQAAILACGFRAHSARNCHPLP